MSVSGEAGLRAPGGGGAPRREGEEHSWPWRAVAAEPPGPAGEAVRGAAARGGGGAGRRARGGACGPAERVRGASWPLEGGSARETPCLQFLPRGRSGVGVCLAKVTERDSVGAGPGRCVWESLRCPACATC